jgi:acetyl-CoA C-acetyltransferase
VNATPCSNGRPLSSSPWESSATPPSWSTARGRRSAASAAARLLERNGLTPADIDLWEINEAFAGVVVASCAALGIDPERVNVNGGAVAIGHPLAASGMRLVLTLAYEMRRRSAELGVATLCGGGGQGEALLLRAV